MSVELRDKETLLAVPNGPQRDGGQSHREVEKLSGCNTVKGFIIEKLFFFQALACSIFFAL
jgi:hypothetical protein